MLIMFIMFIILILLIIATAIDFFFNRQDKKEEFLKDITKQQWE